MTACVCVFAYVCVCLRVCVSVGERNSIRWYAPIWTWFSLNGCLPHWLNSYWYWWPGVNGQGHSDVISIFSLHNSLLTSVLCISAPLCSIKKIFGISLRYALVHLCINFIKFKWEMTSLWRHLSFSKQLFISHIPLNLQTSYLEPIHNNITFI